MRCKCLDAPCDLRSAIGVAGVIAHCWLIRVFASARVVRYCTKGREQKRVWSRRLRVCVPESERDAVGSVQAAHQSRAHCVAGRPETPPPPQRASAPAARFLYASALTPPAPVLCSLPFISLSLSLPFSLSLYFPPPEPSRTRTHLHVSSRACGCTYTLPLSLAARSSHPWSISRFLFDYTRCAPSFPLFATTLDSTARPAQSPHPKASPPSRPVCLLSRSAIPICGRREYSFEDDRQLSSGHFWVAEGEESPSSD